MKDSSLRPDSMFAVSPAGCADTNRVSRNFAFKSLALMVALAATAGVAKADTFVPNPDFCTTVGPCVSAGSYSAVADWTGVGNFGSTNDYTGAFNSYQSLSTLPGSPISAGFVQSTYAQTPYAVTSSLSQEFEASFGGPATYTLSFYQASRAGYGTANVSVYVNGVAVESGVDLTDVTGWVYESFDFFTLFPEISLSFVNNSTQYDSTVLFTDVSVGTPGAAPAPAATPEPSSLMLLGTGLVSAAGVARRRLRRA